MGRKGVAGCGGTLGEMAMPQVVVVILGIIVCCVAFPNEVVQLDADVSYMEQEQQSDVLLQIPIKNEPLKQKHQQKNKPLRQKHQQKPKNEKPTSHQLSKRV